MGTEIESKKVVITLFHTMTLTIQGAGCRTWISKVFKSMIANVPLISTPIMTDKTQNMTTRKTVFMSNKDTSSPESLHRSLNQLSPIHTEIGENSKSSQTALKEVQYFTPKSKTKKSKGLFISLWRKMSSPSNLINRNYKEREREVVSKVVSPYDTSSIQTDNSDNESGILSVSTNYNDRKQMKKQETIAQTNEIESDFKYDVSVQCKISTEAETLSTEALEMSNLLLSENESRKELNIQLSKRNEDKSKLANSELTGQILILEEEMKKIKQTNQSLKQENRTLTEKLAIKESEKEYTDTLQNDVSEIKQLTSEFKETLQNLQKRTENMPSNTDIYLLQHDVRNIKQDLINVINTRSVPGSQNQLLSTTVKSKQQDQHQAAEFLVLNPVIEKYELALLMLLGFAGFSMLIGLAYNYIRRHVYRDFHSLDVIFDAGGRVSFSLTAVTVTSQLIWPADFLQSPTIASKVGVSGSLFYTLAIVLSVLIFAVLCMQLKTRAPGAKTFPQIAYARFGKNTHILFCIVALFTNMVITANLILAGKAAVEVLSKDSSNEFTLMILAVLFGSYCLIGGLGTTFYISYFNTALIFITTSLFILKVTYWAEPNVEEVTSHSSIHDALSCLKGPDGNEDNSFLTFRSQSGIIFSIVTLFMTIAIIFCDQANWQSRIAAKPREGMFGFLAAAFLWYAIPTSVSFVTSMTYKTMSFQNGTNLLTDAEIDAGYITPFVIQSLLGKEGCFVLLTLLTMTLMSTGSGEVMAVSSVLVYDIIKTHISPFRPGIEPTDCALCGKSKIPIAEDGVPKDRCDCRSVVDCKSCEIDVKDRLTGKVKPGFLYQCPVHGQYRHYEDQLLQYKSWCMIWVIIAIIPYGLLIIESGMNLNWAFLASQVFIAPFILPLYFTIGWTRATSKGLISGGITGLICSVTGLLAYGSTYEGGLSDFFTNTAQDYSLLTGLVSGIVSSTVVSVLVSLCGTQSIIKVTVDTFPLNKENVAQGDKIMKGNIDRLEIEWLKTMSIDNPLNPYRRLYEEELQEVNAGKILTIHHMEEIFKKTRTFSNIGIVVGFVVFLVIVPAVALSQGVLTEEQLGTWISVSQHWCLVATVFVVFVPPIQEGVQVWRQYKRNRDFVLDNTSEKEIDVDYRF